MDEDPRGSRSKAKFTRRVVIKTGGALALTAVVPWLPSCSSGSSSGLTSGAAASNGGGDSGGGDGAFTPTPAARFLSDAELETLRALVDRFIPGPPEDLDPGALAGGCAEAIDSLLAAFRTDPPFIYAGAPFSDRAGYPVNEFLEFIPLDPYEEFAWRLAIEGSQGLQEREFNGPVKGMQQIYRDGLARLDQRAQQLGLNAFGDAPGPVRDLILADTSDGLVQDIVDIAFPDTLDAFYGAPEYGGNRDLVGWGFTAYDGDVQPRGYADAQVINADNPGLFDFLLPPSYSEGGGGSGTLPILDDLPAARNAAGSEALLPAVMSSEVMVGAIMAADGSLSRLRAQLKPLAQRRINQLAGARNA